VDRIKAAPSLRVVNDSDGPAHAPMSPASAEITRLLRAFNSVDDRDLRRTLIEFVETAAGIKHDRR
jgi:hypothetical protein